jgi:curved DNA-binding protein CbpA
VTSADPDGHYGILGVAPTASTADVRRAYLSLARQHHPDAGGDALAMQRLNDAWRVLGDPGLRARYDQAGRGLRADDATGDDHGWSPDDVAFHDLRADLEDDRPIGPTVVAPRWLAVLPAATFLSSILTFGFGVLVSWSELIGLSVVLLVLTVVLFGVMPFLALAEARRHGR